MSWFGIGIYKPKYECNVGTLFRTAHLFGAKFVFTVSPKPYSRQASDTTDSTSWIPYYNFKNLEELDSFRPEGSDVVCVELTNDSKILPNFYHPLKGIYLLGNETTGVPVEYCREHQSVMIPTAHSLNVSVAGSIVLYDRSLKVR